MLWSAQRTLALCSAIKSAASREAELQKALSDLFAEVEAEVVRQLELDGVPVNASDRNRITAHVASATERYRETVGEAARTAALEGATAIIPLLEAAGITVSPMVVTDPTFTFLSQMVFEASEGTIARYVGNLDKTLAAEYAKGSGISEIAQVIRDTNFRDMKTWEAARIAQTEVISAQNAGAYDLISRSTAYMQWWTAQDSKVRTYATTRGVADHRILHGQITGTGGTFSNGLRYPGDRVGPIQSWISCFPKDTVVSAKDVSGAYRREYSGEFVTVRTCEHELTGTPNHPVLTNRGWVALGQIKKGDYLVCASGCDHFVGSDHDVDERPPTIAEVFDSAAVTFDPVRVRGLAVDFHGDGAESDVDVVAPDGELLDYGDSALAQEVGEFVLIGTDVTHASLVSQSEPDHPLLGESDPADRIVGGTSQSRPLISGELAHAQVHGLRPVSGGDTGGSEPVGDGRSGDVEILGNRLDGQAIAEHRDDDRCISIIPDLVVAAHNPRGIESLADDLVGDAVASRESGAGLTGSISLQQVTDVDVVHAVRTHVYNLQTESGTYIAGGIVVHNCRCTILPWFLPPDMLPPIGFPQFYEGDLIPLRF